ncbi:MAG: hypothetical protein ABUT20_39620, partial [Bacteroidota bacterium]
FQFSTLNFQLLVFSLFYFSFSFWVTCICPAFIILACPNVPFGTGRLLYRNNSIERGEQSAVNSKQPIVNYQFPSFTTHSFGK